MLKNIILVVSYIINVVCFRFITYIHVMSYFILRFKFDLDTFRTRAFSYSSQIVLSVRAANTVLKSAAQ